MAIKTESVGVMGSPLLLYNDAEVEITSTDVNAQDEIIASQKLGSREQGKCTIQVKESNGKAVKIQPWASLDGSNWREIDYSSTQKYFDVSANATEIVFCDPGLSCLYFKLTGYLASAGTAKVKAHVLFE